MKELISMNRNQRVLDFLAGFVVGAVAAWAVWMYVL